MAQVHRAVLRDGRTVAVKIQRPGIRSQILEDVDVISELAATFAEHVGAANRAGLSAGAPSSGLDPSPTTSTKQRT